MKFIRNIVKWFRNKYRYYTAAKFRAFFVNDFPDQVPEKQIFVVQEGTSPETIIFKCPCGCRTDIYLNLLKDSSPRWRFEINTKKEISISPSINRTVGCRSHFFIQNSRVAWAARWQ